MLLFLGNGFDLQLRLPSSFKDYLNSLKNINMSLKLADLVFSITEELELHNSFTSSSTLFDTKMKLLRVTNNKLLFWHMISFFYMTNFPYDNWSDFEHLLLITLQQIAERNDVISEIKYDKSVDTVEQVAMIVFAVRYFYLFSNEDLSISSMSQWLYTELVKFEDHFKAYLNIEIEKFKSYDSRSFLLLRKIINLSSDKITQLINFNYTIPNKNSLNISEVNIHGRLDSKIIIGIDQTYSVDESISDKKTILQKKYDALLFPFTKTYKKALYSPKEMGINLHKTHKEIVFYGHSLTPQDYSYFQSIFDYYDIYHNDIKLIFAFSNYDQYAYVNTIKNAVKLIMKYGETMSNKDHGRNLLHKLEVENRISIIEIENTVFL